MKREKIYVRDLFLIKKRKDKINNISVYIENNANRTILVVTETF